MVAFWGSRAFGKVDEVPGIFHVSTTFLHVLYLPVVPLKSHLVHRDVPLPIRLSPKSVLTAWLRGALGLSAVWSVLAFAAALATASPLSAAYHAGAAAIAIGLLTLTKKLKPITRCSPARARAIAARAGLDDDRMQLLEAHFLAMDAARAASR